MHHVALNGEAVKSNFWKAAFYMALWNVIVEEVKFCYNMDVVVG